VSGLAIHNLADPELIARVYRDVCAVLAPGGWFLNADLVFPVGESLARLYRRDAGRDADHEGPQGRQGSLADQLSWLTEAGFAQVDCLTKDRHNSLLCAVRGT
jgi:tRNA (cmo5U34)-methyltransferase